MKKKIILAGFMTLTLILVASAIAFTQSPSLQMGLDIKSIKSSSDANKTIAKINGKSITLGAFKVHQYAQKQAASQLKVAPPSATELIKGIAKDELLVDEAKKRGITVSNEEAKQFIVKLRENLGKVPPESQQELKDYLQGLGLSEDEFWSDSATFEAYKQGMYIGRLRASFMKDAKTPEQFNEAETAFLKLGDELLSKANLEIIDNTGAIK